MTLLLDVASAATILFAAGWVATVSVRSASADVRRTIWRTVFVGTAALPVVLSFDPPRAAAQLVAVAGIPAAVTVVTAASQTVSEVPWLAVIWAVGFAFVIGRFSAGLAQVRRWGRGAVAGDEADFSSDITVPMTWGVVRPQILLPDGARTWSDDTRRLVIRHEAAHVASRDWAWQTMARVVTAALWFHPLAWVADRRLRREAERAADDAVIAAGADPVAYADELVRVARSTAMSPVAAIGMVERSSLEQRVRHVLDRTAGRRPASWVVRAAVAVFVAALSVSAAGFQDRPVYQSDDPAVTPPRVVKEVRPPYTPEAMRAKIQDEVKLRAVVPEVPVRPAALQERPVYKLGDGITDPKVIKEVRPQYSKDAMDKGIQGEVILEIVVTEEGGVTDVRVVRSLEESLDRAAIDAALQWRFEPARKNGDPVRVRVTLVLSFRLK